MGIGTGEVFAWPEGSLLVYASASGATTGSGLGYAENARLVFTYGWLDYRAAGGQYRREITGQVANLTIGQLWGDTQLFQLLNASAALNIEFKVSAPRLQQSARHVLYSGVCDSFSLDGSEANLFRAVATMRSNVWSAFGQ